MTSKRYTPAARREVKAQLEHFKAVDSRLARRFVEALEGAVTLVCDMPHIGAPLDGGVRRRPLGKPFRVSVVYAVEASEVVIVAVWPDRRDPSELTERIGEFGEDGQ